MPTLQITSNVASFFKHSTMPLINDCGLHHIEPICRLTIIIIIAYVALMGLFDLQS